MSSSAPVPPSSSFAVLGRLKSGATALGRSRRVRRGGAALLILVVLFGLVGYLWLPGFLHGKLEQTLSGLLERPVTLGAVEVQPYILEVTVRDLRIGNREGEGPLAGFGSLSLNLSSASLLRRALVLDALRLVGPYGHLVRHRDGSTNVTDLVQKFASPDQEDSPPPPFAINNLEITDGRFTLDDEAGGGRHEITELNLGLPRVASFPGEVERQVQPRFSARLDGAPVNGAGEVRPFAGEPDGRLTLRVEGLDLARLAGFSPAPLPLQVKSARLDADLVLGFGSTGAHELSLQGELALRQLDAALQSVALRLEALRFRLDGPDLLQAPIRLADIRLENLALQRSGEAAPFVSLVSAGLDEFSLDRKQSSLALGTLALQRLEARLARTGPERIDLLDTLAGLQGGSGRAGAGAGKAGGAAAPAAPAWKWRVAGIRLEDAGLEFVDRTLGKAVPLRLHGVKLGLGPLASAAGEAVPLEFSSRINEQGSLTVAGQVQFLVPAGELKLDVSGLDLVPLQGWIPHHFKLVLSQGALSARGQLRFGGQPFGVHYQGDAQLAGLSLLDQESAQSLLRWQRLELAGMDIHTRPLQVRLDDVTLSRFFVRLMITPQGQLHLDRLMGAEAGPPAAAATPAGQAVAAASVLPGEAGANPAAAAGTVQVAGVHERGAPLPVSIGRIRLEGGAVLFNDLFIKPNYNANLTGLTGQIGPLAAGERGKLKIQGKVDRSAPLHISGELEPFSQELYLDIKAQARGIDMPTFSPYSGRYMGYLIQKGKLSVDVSYRVEKGELQADNHIFLDQFTLGDPVESPDALSIPIKLGLALLKNSRGEIDINLPIRGSINDPEFSIGGIVFKAIMNLLVKAVTSPFTLLGSLFGGGEELSHVEFGSGLSVIGPEGEQRLQALAKALADRPALTLEVTGMADPVADSEGYRRVLLQRQVKAKKVAADVAQGKSAPRIGEVSLTPQEYEKYLGQVYKEAKFDKPKNMLGLSKSLPVAEMENLLLPHMKLEEDAFRDLAARRGKMVRDWLVEQGQVPVERIFVLAPQVGKGEAASPANRVVFSLR
ncbi:DUF748 domain-containing protein [Azovibrio restrictus]|uniref:DUF748 domain-containing protein n=1 Tax=Azovibrio restrictus TaxID=146938 RepID=UPI0026F26FCF|nr:DUF748 domain-containing protein [Azovibrio restrictus]